MRVAFASMVSPGSHLMSQAEVERFADDVRSDEALLDEIGKTSIDPLAVMVGIAQRRGYSFTLDEARSFVVARARGADKELSDRQLDGAAGGGASNIVLPPGVIRNLLALQR
jgi:Nif11 domain